MPVEPGGAAGRALGMMGAGPGAGSGMLTIPIRRPAPTLPLRRLRMERPDEDGDVPRGRKGRAWTDEVDAEAAATDIYGWDEGEQRDFARRMWHLGYLDSPEDLGGAFQVWAEAVDQAAKFAAAGRSLDPRDVLEMMAAGDPKARERRTGRDRAGTVGSQKRRSVDLTSAADARALIESTLRQAFGRAPTDAEIRTWTATLHKAQQANPTVEDTKTRYDDQGNPVEVTTTVSGGVSAQGFLDSQAQQDPEAADYQAATSLFPALMQALESGL